MIHDELNASWKTFPTLARSEQSQPASARVLLSCALTASPLNFFSFIPTVQQLPWKVFASDVVLNSTDQPEWEELANRMCTMKTTKNENAKTSWNGSKRSPNIIDDSIHAFPPQKTHSSSFVDAEVWMEEKDETTGRRNVAVFFSLCLTLTLRVGSEKMENKRLAAVVTGERPNLNELLIV